MEIFDLYDRNMNLLENKMIRGTNSKAGEYHLVVHVWIKNSAGLYLMQQRSKTDDRFPFQWASCGGAVTTGEISLTTAQREVEEEMGITIDLHKFQKRNQYFVDTNTSNYIIDLYVVEEDVLLSDITLDYTEVKKVDYFTLDIIKDMIRQNKMWNYEKSNMTKKYFDHIL